MASTIQYKPGYPSAERPFQSSASIGADGLVTGEALFLLQKPADGAGYEVTKPIEKNLFSALGGVALSGLFIESRSLQKRGGLWTLGLSVVGAVNPPIIERRVDVSPRSFSKSDTITLNGEQIFLSLYFDYLAETTHASTVVAEDAIFDFSPIEPRAVKEYNRRGFDRAGFNGDFTFVIRSTPKILESETREVRAGIARITKTSQFIYE
jgi:hypothetical protein